MALARAGLDYGNTFMAPSYVRDRWGTGDLEVVDHLRGGLRN